MTPSREWPAHRARAWLLRKAAELLTEDPEVGECVADYLGRDGATEHLTQRAFDAYLHDALSFRQAEIDRAVAEVYGDASVSPTRAELFDAIRKAHEELYSLVELYAPEQRVAVGIVRAKAALERVGGRRMEHAWVVVNAARQAAKASNMRECPSCHGQYNLGALDVSTSELHPKRGIHCPLCAARLDRTEET